VVDLQTLAAIVAARQAAGERAVFTNGCFDLLHLGHVRYLQRARALGDLLIVGLNSDVSTRRIKGPRRPLVPQDERAQLLAALAAVDYVTIFDEPTAEHTVAALRPAVYVKGGDYAVSTVSAAAQTPESDEPGEPGDIVLDPQQLRRALAGEQVDPAASIVLQGIASRLPEARVVAGYGGSLALISYLPGHSTTELIERIVSRYAEPEDATPDASER
jgi:D-beta-D-heptose 7-phosphate kinase/D-beta-D-heptose 1-phosphate adenosyltransferase